MILTRRKFLEAGAKAAAVIYASPMVWASSGSQKLERKGSKVLGARVAAVKEF